MMSVKCAFSRISHRGTSIDVSEQVQSMIYHSVPFYDVV